jgi:uncharacterized protein HemY
MGYQFGIAMANGRIGKLLMGKNQYEVAGPYFRLSLEINEEIDNIQGQAIALTALSKIEREAKNYDDAQRLYLESQKLWEIVNSSH